MTEIRRATRSRVHVHALVLVLALACAALSSHALAAGRLCITAATLSFGNIAVGSSVSATTTVRNCGDQPWTFTDVSVHPATAAAFHVDATCATALALAPGDSCDATVAFAPVVAGQVSGGLWLRNTTSDPERLLTFYGRGVDARAGTATLSFVPPSAAFGAQRVGTQSPPLDVELRNAGPAAITLSAVVLNGPSVYDFDGIGGTCQPGASIASGASCRMTLFFLPQATGPRLASLVVDAPQLASLAILQISGIGTSDTPTIVDVVEYYNAAFDHYFITSLAAEIALCDAGTAPCAGWARTGYAFNAFANDAAPPSSLGACRFFNDTFAPKSAHFYALQGHGCEQTLALFPDWRLESPALFNLFAPDDNGHCASGLVPVYRLYNNGIGGAPNHRFTIDANVRAQMLRAGWLAEGNGTGVAFCAPP